MMLNVRKRQEKGAIFLTLPQLENEGLVEPISISSTGLLEALQRLSAEWRACRSKLGLGFSATVVEMAKLLEIDRGTAQRLNRIFKIAQLKSSDLSYFPGARAWQQVLKGVERVLGAEHAQFQRLSFAIDHYAKILEEMGGSRSAVVRQLASQETGASLGANFDSASQARTARQRWVDAAGESFGYLADIRYDLQMIRESIGVSPKRVDLAMVNGFKGCRGTAGSMPIAFTRCAYTPTHDVVKGSTAADARSFDVLKSMTSQPMPAILSTGDAFRQTIFIEPQWSSLREPLSLALLHEERAAMSLPWGTKDEWFEFSVINRHPCKQLVLERAVSREIAGMCNFSLLAYRSHSMNTHDEPWYDRIPEDTEVFEVGGFEEAAATELFPGHASVLQEALDRLAWDRNDLLFYRAVINYPIPLATYTIAFDRVRP